MSSSFDPDAVAAVTVDSYGTLVDVEGAVRALDDPTDDPERIATLWRARSLQYAFVAAVVGAHRPFYELLGEALEYALAAAGEDLSEQERSEVLETYHELDAFGDVREGLARLADAGYDCHVLSNGTEAMLASMVEYNGLDEVITGTISADAVERFKPAAEPYRHAADVAGASVDEVVHVAAGWWDVTGAKRAGAQAAWVNRAGRPWDGFDVDPDLTVASIPEVADELVG